MKINRKQLSCFLAATATFLLFPQYAYAEREPMRNGTGHIDCQPNGLGVYTALWSFETDEPFFFVDARVKAKSDPARRYFFFVLPRKEYQNEFTFSSISTDEQVNLRGGVVQLSGNNALNSPLQAPCPLPTNDQSSPPLPPKPPQKCPSGWKYWNEKCISTHK